MFYFVAHCFTIKIIIIIKYIIKIIIIIKYMLYL